jgi:hypothetical protein
MRCALAARKAGGSGAAARVSCTHPQTGLRRSLTRVARAATDRARIPANPDSARGAA